MIGPCDTGWSAQLLVTFEFYSYVAAIVFSNITLLKEPLALGLGKDV